VMKMVPVEIQSVDVETLEEVTKQARIAVHIEQPIRHSIFVSRGDNLVPPCAIAVGASNLDLMAEEYIVRGNHTFLDIIAEAPTLRRVNSAPGLLESNDYRSSKVIEARALCHESQGTNTNSTPVASTISSVGSSSLSEGVHGIADDDVKIRIGAAMRPIRDANDHDIVATVVPTCDNRAALRDFLQLQNSGLPSIGSFSHKDGECKCACWFENQRQHGRRKQCSVGLFCERCHRDHNFIKRTRHA